MSDRIGTVRAVSFSPTGSTRRVLRSIAAGIGAARVQEDSLDRPAWREAGVQETGDDELLLVGMPVYAGRVPGLSHGGLPVRGTGDAVCVVSYGNRAYEDALSELVGLTRRAGFRVVAAGAFVTEHSLNGRIAAGRPDEARYGRPIGGVRPTGRRQAARPGRMRSSDPGPGTRAPYKAYAPIPLVPELDPERCERCGRCALVCPVQTIDPGNYRVTDPSRCIACFACVRYCRAGARSLAEPARSGFRAENGSAPRGLPSEARARDISVTARSADGRGRFGRIAFPYRGRWVPGLRKGRRCGGFRLAGGGASVRLPCTVSVPAQPPFFVTNATVIPTDAGT